MNYEEQIRLLVIEDNPGDFKLVQELLKDACGSDIYLENAPIFKSRVHMLQSNSSDIVLLNLSLSDSSGGDSLQAIMNGFPNIPVIIYTNLFEFLKPAPNIPRYHHERWDRTGYPDGLKGGNIPLFARIFTVVDVNNALISKRSYRPAWPLEKTLAHIKEQAGSRFNPKVVYIFPAMKAYNDIKYALSFIWSQLLKMFFVKSGNRSLTESFTLLKSEN